MGCNIGLTAFVDTTYTLKMKVLHAGHTFILHFINGLNTLKMKKLNLRALSLIGAMVMVLQGAAFAHTGADKSQLLVEGTTASAVTLRMINLGQEETTLRIYDADERVVHHQVIDAVQGFAVRLNLADLPAGDYRIVVEREAKDMVQSLTVDRIGRVAMGAMEEVLHPAFAKTAEAFTLTNPEQDLRSVILYDGGGLEVFRKSYKKAERKAERMKFTLEGLPAGEYTIRVQTRHRTYFYTLTH